VALILALTGMVLMLTLGGALVMLTSTETAIAANFRDGAQMFYAAESGIAAAMTQLESVPDWATVVTGVSAPFVSLPFRDVVAGAAVDQRLSVVVWVTDDPINDPAMVVLRSRAYGAHGAERTVETTVWQSAEGVRVLDWRESR
jgi:Tfp pilus assembly protein PilX